MEKTKSILGAEKLEQIQQGIGTSRPRIAGSKFDQNDRKCKIYKKNPVKLISDFISLVFWRELFFNQSCVCSKS